VTVLAGNPATSAAVLGCLNTADASTLRRLHPAVAGVVAEVPWADKDTPVLDTVRWRAALPAAVGARVALVPQPGVPTTLVGAALAGVVNLDLCDCRPAVLPYLPRSLRVLRVVRCRDRFVRFPLEHLTSLEVLDCSEVYLDVGDLQPSLRELRVDDYCILNLAAGFRHLSALLVLLFKRNDYSSGLGLNGASIASLPPSIEELSLCGLRPWPTGGSLAHLAQLRVFCAIDTGIHDATLASLPPCLLELDVADCKALTEAASFAHLPALQALTVKRCAIGDAALASLPPGLAYLDASECSGLTPAAVLPPLPSLKVLGVSHTRIGDALVASLPAGLTELRILECDNVTPGATLDHVRALRALHIHTTCLAPAVVAACRARGCTVSAVQVLRRRGSGERALALLPDGRIADRGSDDKVVLWNAAEKCKEPAAFAVSMQATALVALPDGRRLAVGTTHFGGSVPGYVEVWDAACVPPVRSATIDCGSGVNVLVLLPDGCLAAGCISRIVRVDVDAGAVTAVLEGNTRGLQALAALPDGSLASCDYYDKAVWVWDVDAQACVAKLAGHNSTIQCLAVLPDGRLVSGSNDRTVRLWDVGARVCVGVLSGHVDSVAALAPLPDGRLVAAAGCYDTIMWLWDTRPGAAADSSHPADAAIGEVFARLSGDVRAMVPRPDGRLACRQPLSNEVALLDVPAPVPLHPKHGE